MDVKKVFQLDLHGKKLSRIEGLEKFKFLRTLDVSCNKIRKIHGLENNKDLRELKLYGNEIEVIEGLDRLTELCTLLLQHNNIKSIGNGLTNLKKLRQLRLDNNSIATVSPSDLTSCGSHVTQLDLSHNQLTSVRGLGCLGNLEELKLASNKLSSPPDLSRCKKLQELDVSNNPLKMDSLSSALKPLTQLKVLHLDQIDLHDLSSLARLPSLETVHLSRNHLSSLSGLTRLFPSVEVLNVSYNDLSSIEALSGLGESLSEIQLEGNIVCKNCDSYRKQVHKFLPSLEVIDGVSVSLFTSTIPSTIQMRPLTPSSIGPTLRQMEQHFLEAELQLESLEGEMAARFDLTRAKMDATIRESESIASEASLGDEREVHLESPSNYKDEGYEILDTERCASIASEHTNKGRLKTPSNDKDCCHGDTSRPPTRSGSRAKLTEALAFAEVYSNKHT